MIRRFQRRELFVRCLAISRRTVRNKNWEESFGRKMLLDLSDNPVLLDDAERTIHEALPGGVRGKCERGEVLLSVPKRPNLKTDFARGQTSPKPQIETIEKFFQGKQ